MTTYTKHNNENDIDTDYDDIDNDNDIGNDNDNSIVQYIFIAPYSLKGSIGLVTIKVSSTTINFKRKKYKRKQQNYTAYTISIIIIL